MDHLVALDPELSRFRDAVRAHYGRRLERIVLFGSRARGDHRDDSDYDVGVFLHPPMTRWDEIQALSRITAPFLIELGMLISAHPFRAGSHGDETVFMQEIRRDGVEL